VESQPPGAHITLNGEAKGPAPVDVPSLAVGNYEVRAELKGYEPRSETVAITQDAMDAQLKLVLVRVAPVLGLVEIGSTPSGAAVSVDSAPVGVTPLTGLKLRPGLHQVDFTKEGYEPRSESVRVEAGKKARLDVALTAIVKATPTPTPTPVVVDANTIYENTAHDVDTLAKKVSGSSASYPRRRRDSQGQPGLGFPELHRERNGDVLDPKVTESAGKLIDDSVLEAIRTWRYEPAVKQGVKVKVRVRFKQTFRDVSGLGGGLPERARRASQRGDRPVRAAYLTRTVD
jgi:TonB family protein